MLLAPWLLSSSSLLADEPPRVLVDSIHANNFLADGLTAEGYSYHQM
jgi:hypothetical protein